MSEKSKGFVPEELDIKTGKMKPIAPERLAELARENEELEKLEEARTIRLSKEATFLDLFTEEKRIGEEAQEKEEEVDISDPTDLVSEMWDNLDPSDTHRILEIRGQIYVMIEKKPEDRTDEETRLSMIKVLDYFEKIGYSREDIEAYLPIHFEPAEEK